MRTHVFVANLLKYTTVYIILAEQVICTYYVLQKNTQIITQIIIHNLPIELYCIHCENLVQLGADACATHVQPIMKWKGMTLVFVKVCVRNAKITEVNLERLYCISL